MAIPQTHFLNQPSFGKSPSLASDMGWAKIDQMIMKSNIVISPSSKPSQHPFSAQPKHPVLRIHSVVQFKREQSRDSMSREVNEVRLTSSRPTVYGRLNAGLAFDSF